MKSVALALALVCSNVAQAEETTIDRDESSDRLGRVAAELGASLLGAALPNVLWIPFFLAGPSFGGPSGASVVMAMMTVLLEPLSISTAAWIVHKKMGGQGLWPAAFGGTMLGAAIGGGVLGAVTVLATNNGPAGQSNRTGYIGIASVCAVAITLVATVFMIELHHDQTIAAGAAPLPGGAIGTVSVRF